MPFSLLSKLPLGPLSETIPCSHGSNQCRHCLGVTVSDPQPAERKGGESLLMNEVKIEGDV